MDAYADPLARVVEAMQHLVASRDAKLLQVVTMQDARLAVLEHVAAAEWHSENKRPFVVLEVPAGDQGSGWDDRAEELRADYQELAETLAKAEEPIVLPPLRAAVPIADLRGFAQELGQIARGLPAPLVGLVVVLAPVWIAGGDAFATDVQRLIEATDERLRFVIVESEPACCLGVVDAIGPTAETVDARIDPAQTRADFAQLSAAMTAAPAGVTGARLVGAAGPDLAPPRRGLDPALTQAALPKDMPASAAALADPDLAQALRTALFGAAQAMQSGATLEGIGEQRRARDLCAKAGMAREAIVMELVLGGYLLQAKATSPALDTFTAARDSATQQRFGDLAVQAIMGRAAIEVMLGQANEAIVSYSSGGDVAEKEGATVLGIECFRMAGQLLLGQGRNELAAQAFRRGVALTDKADAETLRHSTAALNARALARVCRDHGLVAQATALESQATAIEQAATVPPAGSEA